MEVGCNINSWLTFCLLISYDFVLISKKIREKDSADFFELTYLAV